MVLCVGCASADDDDQPGIEGAATAPPIAGQASLESPAKVEAGKRLLEQGKYDEAIDAFTVALEEARDSNVLANANEDEARVYLQRGIAFQKAGFPDTAIEDFDDAINLLPRDGAIYEHRSRAHLEAGDFYNALNDATDAIRLKPNNAGAYQVRGEVYLRRDRPERAVADWEQAIDEDGSLAAELQPRLAEAYAAWAQQLAAAGDEAAANEKLARARELSPERDLEVTQTSAVVAADAAAPVEQTVAKPVIDEAVRKFEAGREHQAAGRFDQAIIEYTEAIAIRTDYEDAYLRRGETLLAMGFPDSALQDLRRAANRGAESAESHRLQAQAHMAMDNPNRAALSATDALHADPTHAATYALRGDAYMKLENWDRAAADFQEAIRREPELKSQLEPKLAAARREQTKARDNRFKTGG